MDAAGSLAGSDAELGQAAREVVELLAARGLSIATCESLTGGGICAWLTSVPGSSAVVRGGLITYASDLKVSLAGVNADQVALSGVINQQTAGQMARGCAQVCSAALGVSATGVAGPEGQDGHQPGDVWIAVGFGSEVVCEHLDLSGDRDQVRRLTVLAALRLVFGVVSSHA